MLQTLTMASLVAATALVALLQMAHIRAGILTSHGADVLCPALLYIVTRRNQTILRHLWPTRPTANQAASLNLLLCYAWEFCQRYDLSGTPLFFTYGTFDPFDLLAYTLGVLVPYAFDRFLPTPATHEFFRARLHTPHKT